MNIFSYDSKIKFKFTESINNSGILTHPKTKDGIHTDDEFDSSIRDLDIKEGFKDNLIRRFLSLKNAIQNGEVIEYFYNSYYIREMSFQDIEKELKEKYDFNLSSRMIARWFCIYFGWNARDSNTEITSRQLGKQSEALRGNSNGSIVYARVRSITKSYVTDLLNGINIDGLKEQIDLEKYNKYKRPIDKIRYILRTVEYSGNPIQNIYKYPCVSMNWASSYCNNY